PHSPSFPYTTLFRSDPWNVQSPCLLPGHSSTFLEISVGRYFYPKHGQQKSGRLQFPQVDALYFARPNSLAHNLLFGLSLFHAPRSEEHTSELQSREN